MPWQTIVHSEPKIIETRYSGNLTAAELLDSIMETLSLIHTHRTTLLLGDCSDLQGGHDSSDLKQLTLLLKTVEISNCIKEAIIIPKSSNASENVYFWTFLTQTQGLVVKPFEDRQSALDWLLGPDQ